MRKLILDWRIWLSTYIISTILYLSLLGIELLPCDLRLFLPEWATYALLSVSIVSIAIEATATPYIICFAPIAVVIAVATYRYYGFLASIPFIALAVSATIPFAEAYTRFKGMSVAISVKHRRALYLGDAVLLALFAIDLVLGIAVAAFIEELFTRISGIAVAIYGASGAGLILYDMFRLYTATRIEPYSTKWFVALWFRNEILRKMLESYSDRLRKLIESAGVTEAPIVLAARILTLSIALLAISPAALCLSIALQSIALALSLALALASVATLLIPFLWLHSKVGDRKRQVEDELPWFTLYSAILQRVGIPLYEAFKRLIGKAVLPAIEREAKILNKHVNLLGLDAISALEELARKHPSREFRNLVFGYTSILRTGGDLATYLEDKLREQLRLLTLRLRRFADVAVGTGEILLLFYLIFASVLAVAGSAVADIAQLFTFIGSPSIASALIGYIYVIQPRTVFRYFIESNHLIPAVAVATVAAIALVGGLQGWLSLSIAFLAIGLGYGIQYTYSLRRAHMLEKQLIDLLRDLTELRKIGLPPSRAIERIARSRSYGEPLDSVIRSVAHQIALAIPLSEAVERVYLPSWLARFVFFTIGEIETSGGGSVRVLEMLTDFVEEYYLARKEAGMKLKIYEFLMLMTPLILGCIVSAAIGIAKALSIRSQAVQMQSVALPVRLPSPAEAEPMKLLVVGCTASIAIVASKAIDGSIRSLLRLAIASLLLTVYGLWLDPYIQSVAANLMRSSP